MKRDSGKSGLRGTLSVSMFSLTPYLYLFIFVELRGKLSLFP